MAEEPVLTIDAYEPDEPPEERRIGRYLLHRELASGGMASVHLASVDGAEGFSKLLAVKLIHEHLAHDPSFVEMFLDEARIAARIEHANVCTVFDFGQADDTYYIAMEYLVGETFGAVRDAIRKRPYDPEWPIIAASLTMQACEGLHAAHELLGADGRPVGLVHRDVSPQNLFVTYGGCVKVVDFGIARADGRSHKTAPGTIKGKFAYLAPEQLTNADAIDRRADVWALGVTLWELLALRPLFRQSDAAGTLTAVMTRPVPAPSELAPMVPKDLDAIVQKALSRSLDGRYATARDFGRELGAFCRAHGGVRSAVDIEEWLERLMPGGRSAKQTLASSVRELTMTRSRTPAAPSVVKRVRASEPTDLPSHVRVRSRGKLGLAVVGIALGTVAALVLRRPTDAETRVEEPVLEAEASPSAATAPSEGGGLLTAPASLPDTPAQLATSEIPPGVARAMRVSRMVDARTSMRPEPSGEATSGPTEAPAPSAPLPPLAAAPPPAVAANDAPSPPAPAPAPVAAAPTATPTAPAPPQVAQTRTAPTVAPSPPTFDATVSLRGLSVQGALPASSIRSALDRVTGRFRACYQQSARSAGRDAPADVGVRFALDESGSVRNVQTDGPGSLASCVREALGRLRTRDRPDIGFVHVSFSVGFTPVRAERRSE